jgi:C4-dicarboxylate-specific signal transduction histidine kinase
MNTEGDWQAIAREKARFFGDVSAAISHEINNRIAVIYEKAGLLEDLAARLAHGKEVDPERFGVQSRKIVEQVALAKQIVRNLNRFAHSVDVDRTTIDMTELLEFVAELYARKAVMADAKLSVASPGQSVSIAANPFMVEILVGRALDIALPKVGESGEVTIAVEDTGKGVRLRFSGLADVTEPIDFTEPEQGAPALLEWFGACFRSDSDGTALLLEIPQREDSLQGRST